MEMTDVDFTFDEEQSEQDREKQLRLGRDRRTNGINKLLQDKETREWLWYILSNCGLFTRGTSTDPVSVGYRSGLRDIGLLMLEDILIANPAAYRQMMEENK